MAFDSLVSHPATRSPGLKFIIVIVLTVAMTIPLFLIQLALSDRESTAGEADRDVAAGWGGPQTVAGPMSILPYTVMSDSIVNRKTVQEPLLETAVLLPETLD